MKSFCERHALKELKNKSNTIQMMARVMPSQQLSEDQQNCNGGMCHGRVTWIVRYISDMNIRVIPKTETNSKLEGNKVD